MSLKVLSVNCQGLGDINKRRDVFNYLRNMNHNIYCLQDTHFTLETENDIRTLWGYDCFFSTYSSNSRGVAILFKNNFEFSVSKVKGDSDGNYIILEFTTEGKKLLLCCIYGPNNDDPSFYTNIQEYILDSQCENVIMCGDFNLVLNPELDCYNYKHVNNPSARQKVIDIIEDNDYVDVFRQFHPDTLRYTWRKKNPLKQSRLDFFLISGNLLPSVKLVSIEPSYRSDHSMVTLNFKFNDFIKGKGYWKFNNSLLYEEEFLKVIKTVIENVKKQYAVPVYDYNNIGLVKDEDIAFLISDQLFLETLLMEIRGKCISYSSFK